MLSFKTLDDFDFNGKRVLLRADINSPLYRETRKIRDEIKIASAVQTLRELLDQDARVAMIAHQGRAGQWDFIDLSQHARVIQRILNRDVDYIDDLVGADAIKAIDSLNPGDIILLKNLRSLESETAKLAPEEHSGGPLVSSLAPHFDVFVNDAFASVHRSHSSIVGFPLVLPSAAGRLMERELSNLSRIVKNPSRPFVFVFGGDKFADAIPIIKNILSKKIADQIILGGLVGLAFSVANGRNIGYDNLKNLKGELVPERLDEAKNILSSYGEKIVLPIDVALDKNGERYEWEIDSRPPEFKALDIGTRTASLFGNILSNAGTILISGPVGVFEREEFSIGTRTIFDKSTSSGAFCVIGGGHTTAAANQMGYLDKISYASTGGGALEHFLLGKPLPGVEALKYSATKFE